jgi:hypothetical protein
MVGTLLVFFAVTGKHAAQNGAVERVGPRDTAHRRHVSPAGYTGDTGES